MISIIADTGPLVAYCLRDDQHHAWAVERLQVMRPPLQVCEPVLTEVFWRIAKEGGNPALVWDWLTEGVLALNFQAAEHLADLQKLMRRYADQPMDFADACVVKMSEVIPDCRVFTCDGDFKVYRRKQRLQIPLLFPE